MPEEHSDVCKIKNWSSETDSPSVPVLDLGGTRPLWRQAGQCSIAERLLLHWASGSHSEQWQSSKLPVFQWSLNPCQVGNFYIVTDIRRVLVDCWTTNTSILQKTIRIYYDSFSCIYTGVFADMEKTFKNLLTISTSGIMPSEDCP